MKKQIKTLIGQGRTQQAIEKLLIVSQQLGDHDFHNDVVLQAAHFKKYEQARRQGISSFQEEGISLAKINLALLSLADQIPEEKEPAIAKHNKNLRESIDTPPKGKWWQWIVGLGLLITIPAGMAEITGYNLKDLLIADGTDAFSVTVLVHGKEGKDHRILRNQGKVVLDIGDTREEEDINAEGEATFKGLSKSYQGQQAFISIDHPQPYLPTQRDVPYFLEKGKSIYLEVALKGTDKINGRVLDFITERPLDSVRVSVQDIATYSDEFGWYELNIPPEKQAKFIKVTFYKKGYELQSFDSIAPHIKQELGVSLKQQ